MSPLSGLVDATDFLPNARYLFLGLGNFVVLALFWNLFVIVMPQSPLVELANE